MQQLYFIKQALFTNTILIFIFLYPVITIANLDLASGGYSFEHIIENTEANTWAKLNINEYESVWTPSDQQTRPAGALAVGSPASIILAWSSFAWDSNRRDIIIFGGGHANYLGNDVYRWRSRSLEWERASLPSEAKLASNIVPLFVPIDGVDNAPTSAHTYDNSIFLPIVDRFLTFGGAAYNTGGMFKRPDLTQTGPYFWDPSKADGNKVGGTTGSHVNHVGHPSILGGEMWENRDNFIQRPDNRAPVLNGTTAYMNLNGKDVVFFQYTNTLIRYTVNDINDPSQDVYERVGVAFDTFSGQGAGALDSNRKIFLRTAKNTFTYWSVDEEKYNNPRENFNIRFTPKGIEDFDLSQLVNYGLDYDSKRDRFLLWGGDSDVWSLTPPDDLNNGDWLLELLFDSQEEGPSLDGIRSTGVLGKWKYIEELDIFLGLIDPIKGDIWAYKPSLIPLPSALFLYVSALFLSGIFLKKGRGA